MAIAKLPPESIQAPPKLASEVGDNPLLRYPSYTYNIVLTMMPPDERTLKVKERSYNHGRGIKIVDTSSVGSVVVESLEITTANPGHSQPFYMSAIDHTFKMGIVEPLGGKLPEMIAKSARSFNLPNSQEALFLLEVNFKGYEDDLPVTCVDYNNNEMVYKWYVTITDLEMSLDLKGAAYSLQLVTNLGSSSNTEVLKIEKGVSVDKDDDNSKQNNIQGLITRLEKGLNEYQKELVKEGTQEKADTYKFYVCDTLKKLKFNFDSKLIPTKSEGFFMSIFTDGNIALAPGETIQGFIHQMFGTSPELVKYLTNDAFDEKSAKPKPDSLKKLKKSVLIVTGVTVQSNDSFDAARQKEAVDVEVFVGARALAKDLMDPDELENTSSIDDVSARIDDYIENGLIRKAYKWIYSGENTEILNLDIKFNNLWRIPLSMINDLSAPQAKTKEKKPSKKELYEQRRKQNAQNKKRDEATLKRIQDDKLAPFRFAEDLAESDVDEAQKKQANIYPTMFTPTNTQGKTKDTQSEGKRAEFVSKHLFKQLHAGASAGSGDLITLEFDVLGDPFWLHQTPAGVEGKAPVQDDINFYIDNMGNYKKALKEHLAKTAGQNVDNSVYLEVGVPSADRNDKDLMDLDKEDLITGVYRIFSTVHTFTGGKFTSKLKGTKDPLMGQKAKEAMQKKTRIERDATFRKAEESKMIKEFGENSNAGGVL